MSDATKNAFYPNSLQLKRYCNAFGKLTKVYQQLALDRTGNYFRLVETINKIETNYTQIENSLAKSMFDQWLKNERNRLDDAKRKLTYDFGRLLAELFSQSGFQLEGNFPELRVKFLLLEPSMQTGRCKIWYGYREEFLNSVPFNAEAVHNATKLIYNGITKREFNDRALLKNLFNAYRTIVLREQRQVGDEIGIIEALVELNYQQQSQKFLADPRRNTFQEYPREKFSYDLFRLKEREFEDHTLNLSIASREQNRKRESYLWVPSNESFQGNVFSKLSFRRMK